MTTLEADSFILQSFDTLTGLKFFVTADPESKKLDAVLHEVYELYSDYVLKVPHGHPASLSHSLVYAHAHRPPPLSHPRCAAVDGDGTETDSRHRFAESVLRERHADPLRAV